MCERSGRGRSYQSCPRRTIAGASDLTPADSFLVSGVGTTGWTWMKAVLFGVALGVVSAGAVIATLVATSYLGAAALFVVGFLGIAVAGAVFMRARLGKSALRSRTRARAVQGVSGSVTYAAGRADESGACRDRPAVHGFGTDRNRRRDPRGHCGCDKEDRDGPLRGRTRGRGKPWLPFASGNREDPGFEGARGVARGPRATCPPTTIERRRGRGPSVDRGLHGRQGFRRHLSAARQGGSHLIGTATARVSVLPRIACLWEVRIDARGVRRSPTRRRWLCQMRSEAA